MNFEDIYKAYWDKVFRLCMGYFNDYPLAQDLAQDVFARVWQYLPSFKGESSVGSWIFRIATNICLRQGERQRRISQTVPPDVSVEAADDRSLHVQALYKAISGLSETDRLIISLYLENLMKMTMNRQPKTATDDPLLQPAVFAVLQSRSDGKVEFLQDCKNCKLQMEVFTCRNLQKRVS